MASSSSSSSWSSASSRLVLAAFCLLVGCAVQLHTAPVASEAVRALPSALEKSADKAELDTNNMERSTAEEKALHDEVAVPEIVKHPRLDGMKPINLDEKPDIDEMALNHLTGLGQTIVGPASSKRSSPTKPEVDAFGTFGAPAQEVQGSVLDAREEFINEARKLSALLPEDVDISPRTAAEYLMITGDFDSFDQAIVDLVESDLLSVRDAERYRQAVNMEFDMLTSLMLEAQRTYEQPSGLSTFIDDSQQELPESEVISSGPASYQSPHPAFEVDAETESADDNFPSNDASLGELLEMLSQQYKMKPSQSEQTHLLPDSVQQYDATSEDERPRQQSASSGIEKDAENELEALTNNSA